MVTARGGQSASTISLIAPATSHALALHSRMTFAERSRNWIRYCTVSGPQHLKRPVQRPFKAARDNQEPADSRGKTHAKNASDVSDRAVGVGRHSRLGNAGRATL